MDQKQMPRLVHFEQTVFGLKWLLHSFTHIFPQKVSALNHKIKMMNQKKIHTREQNVLWGQAGKIRHN